MAFQDSWQKLLSQHGHVIQALAPDGAHQPFRQRILPRTLRCRQDFGDAQGRPPIDGETEALIVRMARENSGWGYDRVVGALANLGRRVSDQTVANVLRR